MALNTITCPACGIEEPVEGDPIALHDIGEFKCDACCARTVYGRLMPFVVIEPCKGERDMLWVRVRYQDPKTRADLYVVELDPKMVHEVSVNQLSLVRL
jgi:hypothetical protein